MRNKKIFLAQILTILFMFFTLYVQENYFINKNQILSIKEVSKICSLKTNSCVAMIDWQSLDKGLDINIVMDVIQYQPIFNSIIYILFGLTTLLFVIFLKKKRKVNLENGEAKEKNSILTVFLFSLFSMYKILFLYTNNILEISFYFPLILAIIFFCTFFIFYKIFSYILKNDSDALIATFTLMLFFANIKTIQMYSTNVYINISILFVVISLLLSIKTDKIISFFKPVAITLILMCLINGFSKLGQVFLSEIFSKDKKENVIVHSNLPVNNKLKRDIYIIILDMYPAKETTDVFGYDNSPFIAQLKERGFLVFENIKSNYNKTGTSIPSILNFDYVGNLQYENANDAVHNAKLFQLLKKNNYTVYYLNSWPTIFDIKRNKYIDYCICNTSQNNKYIQEILLRGNVLSYFFDSLFDNSKLSLGLNYVDKILEDKTEKKASFIHLLMPHWPYLYDEKGRKLKETYDKIVSKSHSRLNEKSFLSFLQYTNKITIEYIDKILSIKKEKPIIIITGDHGIREDYYHSNEEKLFEELEKNKDLMKKHFNTFLAYYNPEMNQDNYKEVKSLVNFFRKFANENFETNYQPLQDKHFYILYSNSGAIFSVTEDREIKDIL